MPMTLQEFIDAVEAEYNPSHPNWIAKIHPPLLYEVSTVSNRFVASATERDHIQNLGRAYGCHTCDSMIEHTPPRYIVDHIPPKEIMGFDGDRCQYRYFAHCDHCAAEQTALVRRCSMTFTPKDRKYRDAIRSVGRELTKNRLTNAKVQLQAIGMMDPKQRKLLCGGRFERSIPGRYGDLNKAERDRVNQIGRAYGCHSCSTRVPMSTYHADHCPPREFGMTAWFPALMQKLNHPMPQQWSFRPQCPDCSHKQGVRCRKLVKEARQFLVGTGVIRYSDF